MTAIKNQRIYNYLVILACCIIFIVMAAVGLRRLQTRLAGAEPIHAVPLAVKTIVSRHGVVNTSIPALATVKSAATVQIRTETGGSLLNLPLREGDPVKAGQIIGLIDSREQDAQLQAASARKDSAVNQVSATSAGLAVLTSQVDAATTNSTFWANELKRSEELLNAGAIAQTEYENTRNRHAEASSRLASLKSQIEAQKAQVEALMSQKKASEKDVMLWKVRRDYSEIISPVDGIISARLQEAGNRVMPGTTVYVIEDNSHTRLIMQIPQESVRRVASGQAVIIRGDVASRFVVSRIFPVQNELRQVTIEAETRQTCTGLVYDMQIPVRIVIEQGEGSVVSEQACFIDFNNPKQRFVYLVKDSWATRVPVTPLLNGDDGLTLLSDDIVPVGTELAIGSYLENIRLPASFAVEVIR
ncbi:MAG TPA: efflux RND transporter periplasmic adaptor subunit [Candidatus Rifleibacterium sp.]|nr:efflux RND transporter periplasmic adaptor subunit [Candidatus Rifleibacterium sp.]